MWRFFATRTKKEKKRKNKKQLKRKLFCEMPKRKGKDSNWRKMWSDEELEHLKQCIQDGMKLRDISEDKFFVERGRTLHAIHVYFYKIKN